MAAAALYTATSGMGMKASYVKKHGPVSEGMRCEEPIALARTKGFNLLFKKSSNTPGELAA
eukprot:3287205-Lingulodinium_polyedra.AAC.1